MGHLSTDSGMMNRIYRVAVTSVVLGLIYGRKVDSVFNRVEFTVEDGCFWVEFS